MLGILELTAQENDFSHRPKSLVVGGNAFRASDLLLRQGDSITHV